MAELVGQIVIRVAMVDSVEFKDAVLLTMEMRLELAAEAGQQLSR